MSIKPYVLLDRDGTLIPNIPYLSNHRQVSVTNEVISGLRIIKSLGFNFGIISNQSGVGRGLISARQLMEVNSRLVEILSHSGIFIDFFLCCVHQPSLGCNCRKPKIGLLQTSKYDKSIDKSYSYMIGDSVADIEFALLYGVTPILISNKHEVGGLYKGLLNANNFIEAAYIIQDLTLKT